MCSSGHFYLLPEWVPARVGILEQVFEKDVEGKDASQSSLSEQDTGVTVDLELGDIIESEEEEEDHF